MIVNACSCSRLVQKHLVGTLVNRRTDEHLESYTSTGV